MKKIPYTQRWVRRHELKMMLNKLGEQIAFMFIIATTLVSIVSLVFGISIFWIGFHNLDLGQNMRWLEATFDLDLVDHTSQGNIVTGEEAYRMGTSQILHGLIISITSAALFIGSLFTIIYTGRGKHGM
jgi:hypothetical protein